MKEYLVWYKRVGDPEWGSTYHIIKARTDAEAQYKVYTHYTGSGYISMSFVAIPVGTYPEHVLYKTGDSDAPEHIKDRNGDVALNLCRRCGRGEVELSVPCGTIRMI